MKKVDEEENDVAERAVIPEKYDNTRTEHELQGTWSQTDWLLGLIKQEQQLVRVYAGEFRHWYSVLFDHQLSHTLLKFSWESIRLFTGMKGSQISHNLSPFFSGHVSTAVIA